MNVYIKAQESVCLVHPEIKIKDIMSLYCTDKDLDTKTQNAAITKMISPAHKIHWYFLFILITSALLSVIFNFSFISCKKNHVVL